MRTRNSIYSFRVLTKDSMLLYRHSTECLSAVQIFLDENPQYWCLVPMKKSKANQEELNIKYPIQNVAPKDKQRSDQEIRVFIENLPVSPPGYGFTKGQYDLQYVFFQNKQDLIMPNKHLDLYNAKIIAVCRQYSLSRRCIIELSFVYCSTTVSFTCFKTNC